MLFFGERTQNNAALNSCEMHIYQDAWLFTRKIYGRLHFNHVA